MINLDNTTLKNFKAGTHRACCPSETFEKYKHFMPMMGITRLANITGLDRIGLPVVVSIRPNSRAIATSQGKGDTLIAAKTSALMESMETWHAERHDVPLKVASYNALKREGKVIDVYALPQKLASNFDPRRPMEWCKGVDVTTGESIWVPYETVSINFVYQADKAFTFCNGSNGLASGNRYSEAVLHALFEVIERDAWTLWNLLPAEQQKHYQIDLAQVKSKSENLKTTLELVESKGILVAAWDITSDVGIPTYYCVILEDPDRATWVPIVSSAGCGTHLDPVVALSRALNEAIQSRATVISGSRDDQFPSDYSVAIDKQDHINAKRVLFDAPSTYPFPVHEPAISDHFEGDIKTTLEQLKAVNIEQLIVVDLAREEVGLPVVKVIVPGLEGLPDSDNKPGLRAKQKIKELS